MINSVLEQSEGDAIGSQMKIRGFLNACHPDEVGHIGNINFSFDFAIDFSKSKNFMEFIIIFR